MSASPGLGGKCRACEAIGQECVHRSEYLNPVSFARFFTLPCTFLFLYSRPLSTTVREWQASIYCRSVRNCFCVSAHTCPFRQLRWHLPRQAGTAYGLHTSLLTDKRWRLETYIFLYFPSSRDSFFLCIISLFFVFAILIFLFSGVKISVFFLKTGISFIFILLLYQLYCKPKNIFSWHYIFIPV